MSELFEKLCQFITDSKENFFTLSMISETYGAENARFVATNRCQDSYSVAKAFVVTAAGIAYDRGLLRPTDKLTDVLSAYVPADVDPRWHNITVDDALLHKMGLPSGFLDIDAQDSRAFGTDYLHYTFTYPFEKDPCVERCYTDGAYYLLSRAVEQVTGEPIDTLLWPVLFAPLGFKEVAWSRCPQGHPMGATGLYIRTEDTVKLGEVYRCGGLWNGQRIVSEEWVNLVLSRGYELRPTGIGSSYAKGGMYGQKLAVFPDKKLSVAWHGFKGKGGDNLLQIIQDTPI